MTIRGCTGKIPYVTRTEANVAKTAFLQRKGAAGLRAYHCGNCGNFHLGRDPTLAPAASRAEFDKGAKVRRYWQLMRGGA